MNNLFGGVYNGRNVLVTGHTGFKGSWLCLWLSALGAHVSGLALAPDTEPCHWDLLGLKTVQDLRVDLRNAAAVRQALEKLQPEIIFHLAAQSLVRRSYREPVRTFDTNIIGLVNLLEAVRTISSVKAIVGIATDKVYLEQDTSGYRETDSLGGHDPYSTSKACAELITECYRKSFLTDAGIRIATGRAGNVVGGGDWSEDRLVPDLARAYANGQVVRIRNPNAIRPWQHVLEPLSGYLLLGQKLLAGKPLEGPWNFGPPAEATLSVRELIAIAERHWPELHTEYQSGPHPYEALTLRLDCSKARQQLAWLPVWTLDETFEHTTRWYRNYYQEDNVLSRADLDDYVDTARLRGIGWAQ